MTLFGNNERKKRGLVVPVMALAVCAVAMVGLGFAINSSVTSNSNDVEELMIDMMSLKTGENSNYSTLDGSGKPGNGTVNGIYNLSIRNDKVEGNGGIEVTGGCAYMKVYGNIANTSLTMAVEVTTSVVDGVIPSMTFSVFKTTDDGKINGPAISTATVGLNSGKYTGTFSTGSISCNKVYIVAITEISGCGITYSADCVGALAENPSSITSANSLNYIFTVTA